MPPDPLSRVNQVELSGDGKTVTIDLQAYGFNRTDLVVISGHAIQDNGAVATFYEVQEVVDTIEDKDEELAKLQVTATAIEQPQFDPDEPIAVIANATASWITTLQPDNVDPSSGVMAKWKEDHAGYAVSPTHRQSSGASSASGTAEQTSAGQPLRHGKWWDRVKADPLPSVMEGRFTRLFPYLPTASFKRRDLEELARVMTAPEEPEQEGKDDPEENKAIPAAYTYLGQFVDHDLTFDPISHLREILTPAQLQALVDFRTPRFDLDNLYGRGPDDQPYMYDDDGICLLPGEPMPGHPFDPGAVQLPRGPNGRALIGDPRNDENRIVAQLHAIFLRFHNRVVDTLRDTNKHVSFQHARDQVRWHYQWVLVKDFLPTILDKQIYENVFPDPFSFVTTIPRLRQDDLELMPVEFSVAAYRFGHSMIRPRYKLNPEIEQPIFANDPGDDAVDLGGFRPIPPSWAIDWQLFIDLGHDGKPAPQFSYKIDTSLVHPLGRLPDRIAQDPSSLALRNLMRGQAFQLPSGQQVAASLGIPPIPDAELMIGPATTGGERRPITEVAPDLAGNAPLWAYILSEAQVMSWEHASGPVSDETPIKLGPVGGRLVAEVFASLLRGDHTSYLYAKPTFKPIRAFTREGTFGLAQLINVVLGRAP